jgi:4'-phosphopantetheinyl transferase
MPRLKTAIWQRRSDKMIRMEYFTGGEKPPWLSVGDAITEIRPGDVQIWWLETPQDKKPDLEKFVDLTAEPERLQAARFHFAADSWSYLVAQSLLRWALGRQLGIRPAHLKFRRNPYGRPLLDDDSSGLFFSLTHARGMVACALARDMAIGVDVERADRDVNAQDLARDYFAPLEVAHLNSVPPADRLKHFFIQWTVKESFLKAIGMGLHAPVSTLAVIPGRGALKTSFEHSFPEKTSGWGFGAVTGLQGYHLALAIRSEQAELNVRISPAPRIWEVNCQH